MALRIHLAPGRILRAPILWVEAYGAACGFGGAGWRARRLCGSGRRRDGPVPWYRFRSRPRRNGSLQTTRLRRDHVFEERWRNPLDRRVGRSLSRQRSRSRSGLIRVQAGRRQRVPRRTENTATALSPHRAINGSRTKSASARRTIPTVGLESAVPPDGSFHLPDRAGRPGRGVPKSGVVASPRKSAGASRPFPAGRDMPTVLSRGRAVHRACPGEECFGGVQGPTTGISRPRYFDRSLQPS